MAISLGTPTNSGNLTNSTGTTLAHTTAANTKTLVVIVTGADSSDSDSVVSGITFNGVALTSLRRYLVNPYQIWIWYLTNPTIGTANVVVTMAGANTDLQVTAIGLISATAGAILPDNYAESTTAASMTHTLVVNPARTGSYALGGIVDIQAAITGLSVTASYGTEITGSEADMGSQVVGCAYRAAVGTTAEIRWTKSANAISYALIHTFYEDNSKTVIPSVGALALAGFAPTVAVTQMVTASPETGVLTLSSLAPTVFASDHKELSPQIGVLTFDGFAPTVLISNNVYVTPVQGQINYAGFAPVVSIGLNFYPGLASLIISGFAPSAAVTNHKNIDPGSATLIITGFAPTVFATNSKNVAPDPASLAIAGFSPVVIASDNKNVSAGVGELVITSFAPIVSLPKNVIPAASSLIITGFAPVVAISAGKNIATDVGSILIAGFTPAVRISDNISVIPQTGVVELIGFAPIVLVSSQQNVNVGIGVLSITAYAPEVKVSDNKMISPHAGELIFTGMAPTIEIKILTTLYLIYYNRVQIDKIYFKDTEIEFVNFNSYQI